MSDWLDRIRWGADGLIPVVTQETATGRVLTVAWVNREALQQTAATGEAHYWSRSRKKLWHKGEESGHVQKVAAIRLDCDEDVLLFEVEQVGGIACHTGRHSCFFNELQDGSWVEVDPVLKDPQGDLPEMMANIDKDILLRLGETIAARKGADAAGSYVASLFAKGEDVILRKVLEEATETLLASKEGDKLHVVRETADLWFHTLVLLAWHGVGPEDVLAELQRREGLSGVAEKASRKP